MNRLTPEKWKELTNDEICGITQDCPYHNMTAVGGGETECDICPLAKQLKKLAAYEDLGMDPDDAKLATCYDHNRQLTKTNLELAERLTAAKKVAEQYESLQRNGRLQIAPCALGRQVFAIFQGYVEATTVHGIKFTKNAVYIDTGFGGTWQLNKDVFLSSSEAHDELRRQNETYRAERAAREAAKNGNSISG